MKFDKLLTMKLAVLLLVVFYLVAYFCLGCATTSTSPPDGRIAEPTAKSLHILYFPETGHSLQSPFLAYYLSNQGLNRLGYPITEALTHEGWQVQYFQNARLEIHPENDPAYFITVGWLGQLNHRTQAPIHHQNALQDTKTEYHFFPETGHTLSGDFLTFFRANGDTVQFGRPISEPFIHRGRISQDFQSARFIWYPDLPPQARVQLEPLGETYFLSSGLSLRLLDPIPPPPNATRNEHPLVSLPENTEVKLTIETTPNPAIIRVIATFFVSDLPLENYTPLLSWGENRRELPPTRSSGQTHTLINISMSPTETFRLYTISGQKELASITY
ncbi:MAG: hypothetical protein GWO38_03600 [Phycisphaerae bacterium]|nr:hypothetical protein [Phycisphaerae bacterium]NIX26729.1 hypothetical protein [Phycisphaerae bacterium]